MIYTPKTKKAMQISYKAHHDQVDKANVPYIFHPIHLAEQMQDETTCIVALLHDVLEDTNVTIQDLENEFSKDILEALKAITRKENEDYFEYILRVKENKYAKIVKQKDLEHNMDRSRLETKDEARNNKYKKAKELLSD